MIKFDAVDCKQKYEIMKENAETLAKMLDKEKEKTKKAIEYIEKHIEDKKSLNNFHTDKEMLEIILKILKD